MMYVLELLVRVIPHLLYRYSINSVLLYFFTLCRVTLCLEYRSVQVHNSQHEVHRQHVVHVTDASSNVIVRIFSCISVL
jgi:hypothetical protein